ncbi:MAG TPA: hypothetical protein VN700_08865 [Vicinamibacterales bacterium]|nr:hypothetical protein [Vicinamibacterales bacterium]
MPHLRRLSIAAAFAALTVLSASASGPMFWTVASPADFLKGTSDGVFISLQGVLSPGPSFASRLTSTPAQIWSVAESADGAVWAGTGGDGKLLRLRAGQPEATAFDADEPNIFAIAASGNRVFAATSPDGRVYVIEGNAPARMFFDPEEKYIWALSVDASGRLWVGAGNPAVIYRVEANGTSRAIYKPSAAHVVTLTKDPQGRILAGTESPGRLYRIGADDRPFALLDSGLTEVRAVTATADGTIYAAAVTRGDEATPAGSEPAAVITSLATISVPVPSAAGSTSAPARKALLYRIDTSGAWEAIWESQDTIYDLAAGDDGRLLIATGPEGRLYRLEGGRDVLLLTGVDAKQITRFAGAPRGTAGELTFATANPGRVMSTGTAASAPATFVSTVKDTKSLATWGLLRWVGSAVTFSTRSGNTEKPDDSWSDWSAPLTRGDGEAITSPPARFLQWRATFNRASSQAARLTSVTAAYLPRNTRPVVTSLTVHPPGVVFQRPFSSEDGAIAGLDDVTAEARRPPGDTPPSPSPGRRMFQKGLQTFAWKAEDADSDRLVYSVQYRREGESTWRDLRSGLADPMFVWDTTSVADGRYLLRIRATDSPTNSADRVLTGERESDPFEIDNTPPQIAIETARTGNQIRLTVRVRDTQSPVQKLEYAIAGNNWQVVYPVDGLSDSLDERYEIVLPADAVLSRVVIRATDLLQNVASAIAGG